MKDFQALRTELNEAPKPLEETSQAHMPPNILILKRKTVRQYQGGMMVALYYNEDLNQFFSIPYGPQASGSVITPMSMKEESVEVNEDVMSHLHKVMIEVTDTPLWFQDGTSVKVDPTTAQALLTVHEALDSQNQLKFARLVGQSHDQFSKMLDFSWKHVT